MWKVWEHWNKKYRTRWSRRITLNGTITKITLDGVNTQTMRKLDGNVAGQDPLSTCLLDLDSDRAI